jgi:hypothetical protein
MSCKDVATGLGNVLAIGEINVPNVTGFVEEAVVMDTGDSASIPDEDIAIAGGATTLLVG